MATHATASDVSTLKQLYAALIQDMTYSASAAVLAIYKQQATNALNLWADAALAYQNLNASAASSYGSSVGTSVTKRELDDARQAVAAAWDEFASALERGGVTPPSTGTESVAYWDLSGGV